MCRIFCKISKRLIVCLFFHDIFRPSLAHSHVTNYQTKTFCNVIASPSELLSWPVSLIECGIQCSRNHSCSGFAYNDMEDCQLYSRDILSESLCSFEQSNTKDVFVKEKSCVNNGSLQPNNSCVCLMGYIGDFCEEIIEDCSDGFFRGFREDGIYWIKPKLAPEAFQVSCKMKFSSGSTIIHVRSHGSKVFNRSWDEYKRGFYNRSTDFWLGNEKIHWISERNFEMASETDNFAVTYTSADPRYDPPHMHYCNMVSKIGFSTYDRENDRSSNNCASSKGVGFWFQSLNCDTCNITASDDEIKASNLPWTTTLPPLGSRTTEMSLKRMPPPPGLARDPFP